MALSERAHNSLANSYILRYYQNDEDKMLQILLFIEDMEHQLAELDKFLSINWFHEAIDYVDIERSDFVDVKPVFGSRFSTFRLKVER